MGDDSGERAEDLLRRLRDRRAADEDVHVGKSVARQSGLWRRLSGDSSTPDEEIADGGGIHGHLLQTIRRERALSDLLLTFSAGPRAFQIGNFFHVVSSGQVTHAHPGELGVADGDERSYAILDMPHADIDQLPDLVGGDHSLELLSPALRTHYRFTDLNAVTYLGRDPDDPEQVTRRVPVAQVMFFPFLELRVKRGPGMMGKLYNIIRERDAFGPDVGGAIADVVVPSGGAVFEIRYWIHHAGANTLGGPLFTEQDIECIWTGS